MRFILLYTVHSIDYYVRYCTRVTTDYAAYMSYSFVISHFLLTKFFRIICYKYLSKNTNALLDRYQETTLWATQANNSAPLKITRLHRQKYLFIKSLT
jgi:hypothetical protein